MAVTLTRDERDALRADVVFELGSVDELGRAARAGTATAAKAIRHLFEEDMRLLDDLGWAEDDERESFTLTMPLEQLKAVLQRFCDQAEADLESCRKELKVPRHPRQKEEDYVEGVEAIREEIDHKLDVRSACLTALEAVGAEGRGP